MLTRERDVAGSDVLTQLASMRKQLQSERRRVENALENSKVSSHTYHQHIYVSDSG